MSIDNICDVERLYKVKGNNDSRLVVIEPSALNAMLSLRQLTLTAHEAGGVLIGERRGDSFVVKEVTRPSPSDKSSRFTFIRNRSHHQQAIIESNFRTNGTSNYLGEWHTHPQDNPLPSSIDLKNWMFSLRNHAPCLVSVVGRKKEWWALYENNKFYTLVQVPM